jgi:hypothetical protein
LQVVHKLGQYPSRWNLWEEIYPLHLLKCSYAEPCSQVLSILYPVK